MDNNATGADGLNLILGIWLIISPFIGLGDIIPAAAWNSWIVGAIVATVALVGLSRPRAWEEWVHLFAGIWMFFAPFMFGYSGVAEAAWNQLIVGAAIAVVAVFGLAQHRQQTPTEPT